MNQATVYTRVLEALDPLLGGELDLSPSSRLVEDLELDSLSMVEARLALEREFGLDIPDEAMAEMATVDDLHRYISTRLQARD